jgi:hypothetical protein
VVGRAAAENHAADQKRGTRREALIAAAPIMVALSGAAVGGTADGVVGGLVGLGIPEIEGKWYEERLRSGNYVIAVDADERDEVDRAKEIFKDELKNHRRNPVV